MSDVLCISEETDFYVDDDRRFSERLASFRDDSFDLGENTLPSTTTEHQHSNNGGVSEYAVMYQQRPTSVIDQTAGKVADVLVKNVNKPTIHASDSLNDGESVLVATSSAVNCHSREHPKSTTSVELSLSKTRTQSTMVDCSSFSRSIISNGQSLSTCTDSVEEPFSLCHIKRADREDDATILSEPRVDENTDRENCIDKETKGGTDTHIDVFGESQNSHDPSLDTTLCGLSTDIEMDDFDGDEKHFSYYHNIETEEDAVKMNGCGHQLCSDVEKSDSNMSKYEQLDSSTSTYDRMNKYDEVEYQLSLIHI